MRLLFAKSKWELPECELGDFLGRIKAANFDASELYLPGADESDEVVRRRHADAG